MTPTDTADLVARLRLGAHVQDDPLLREAAEAIEAGRVMSPPGVIDTRLVMLGRENALLTKLLADPHPGLHTWVLAVCETVREMAAIIDGARDE